MDQTQNLIKGLMVLCLLSGLVSGSFYPKYNGNTKVCYPEQHYCVDCNGPFKSIPSDWDYSTEGFIHCVSDNGGNTSYISGVLYGSACSLFIPDLSNDQFCIGIVSGACSYVCPSYEILNTTVLNTDCIDLSDNETCNIDDYFYFNHEFFTGITPTTTTTTLYYSINGTYFNNLADRTPCISALFNGSIKESLTCLYIGRNFQRDDGSPTMGYFFWLIVVDGLLLIFYLKNKNLGVVSIILLIFLGSGIAEYPPEVAIVHWAIATGGLLITLYKMFEND